MSITAFQRQVCRLIASNRVASGESYVAGGLALNILLGSSRISEDIDLFHDAEEAVEAAWMADSALLEQSGYLVTIRRRQPTFIDVVVTKGPDSVIIQWAQDSAYRFFPLQEHVDFGLTLHPFDLATNKVLALVQFAIRYQCLTCLADEFRPRVLSCSSMWYSFNRFRLPKPRRPPRLEHLVSRLPRDLSLATAQSSSHAPFAITLRDAHRSP